MKFIIGSDNANMEDFEKTGFKIKGPNVQVIDDTLHSQLLKESLVKYGDIWTRLAKE